MVWGLPTGFDSVDYYTGGLHAGEATLLGARTSVGKTSFGTQISTNIAAYLEAESAEAGERTGQILYFSPEMSTKQLVLRVSCQWAGIDSMKLRRGQVTEEEQEAWVRAVQSLTALDAVLRIQGGRSMDITDVYQQVLTSHREGPPVRLVVLDYLQRFTYGDQVAGYQKATDASLLIKDMANVLSLPVIVLSQMRRPERGKEDEPPTMNELRDSGRIEEDADNVWILHRPMSKRTVDPESSSVAILDIAKARSGIARRVTLGFKESLTQFTDYGLEIPAIDG